MSYIIRPIDHHQILSIRHTVMWPNKSPEYVKLPNDETGRHFGLFIQDKLISVISIFETEGAIQFRKFATLNAYQGQGLGSKLLRYIIGLVEKEGCQRIWCNARVNKINYYHKFGMQETDIRFEKGGVQYVVMEKMTS